MKVNVEIDDRIEQMPLSVAFTYLREPDGDLRKRSYGAIEQAFTEVEEPLAACLNGIKGAVNTVNIGRGREDALHSSLDQSRIDREILETMLEVMRGAFPLLRRYLLAKARLLGKERLAPWDLVAPVGSADRIYEWTEAQEFIIEQFATYSPELRALAERAFVEGWIDAEPRAGKRGGGFCARIPSVQESRILVNYNGRMGQLATLAHELGHAYHNQCLRGKSNLQSDPPMTLAETASIPAYPSTITHILSGCCLVLVCTRSIYKETPDLTRNMICCWLIPPLGMRPIWPNDSASIFISQPSGPAVTRSYASGSSGLRSW